LGDGLDDGGALGANGESVAGVFHVAAGENPARWRMQRRAHFEMRKRSVRKFPRRFGRFNPLRLFAHGGRTYSLSRWAASSAILGSTASNNEMNCPFTRSPVSKTSW